MYLGSTVEYIVRLGEQRLIVVDADPHLGRVFSEGTTAGLAFKPETVHLLAESAA